MVLLLNIQKFVEWFIILGKDMKSKYVDSTSHSSIYQDAAKCSTSYGNVCAQSALSSSTQIYHKNCFFVTDSELGCLVGGFRCSCFGPRTDGQFKQKIENATQELKSLQDNLNFATLAAVGNRISHPISSPRVPIKRSGPEKPPTIVGLDPHIQHITEFMKKNGVCLIGIYGQSGLGKTTLLNEIVSKVEISEKRLFAYIELNEDLRKLQSSLLLQLGGGKKDFTNTAQGRSAILYQLQKLKQQNKVVRIAIDNLFDVRLVGELFPHSLGKVLSNHSSVLITCSSLAVLGKVDQLCRPAMPAYNYLPYKLPHMTSEHAKTLFITHASNSGSVVNTLRYSLNGAVLSKYAELADNYLPLCEGLPMAVKVVGSYFANPVNREDENWTSIVKRMKQVEEEVETSEDQMFAKLMVSRTPTFTCQT